MEEGRIQSQDEQTVECTRYSKIIGEERVTCDIWESGKESDKHKNWIKRLKKLEKDGEEDEIVNLYAEAADGWSAVDHAVGRH